MCANPHSWKLSHCGQRYPSPLFCSVTWNPLKCSASEVLSANSLWRTLWKRGDERSLLMMPFSPQSLEHTLQMGIHNTLLFTCLLGALASCGQEHNLHLNSAKYLWPLFLLFVFFGLIGGFVCSAPISAFSCTSAHVSCSDSSLFGITEPWVLLENLGSLSERPRHWVGSIFGRSQKSLPKDKCSDATRIPREKQSCFVSVTKLPRRSKQEGVRAVGQAIFMLAPWKTEKRMKATKHKSVAVCVNSGPCVLILWPETQIFGQTTFSCPVSRGCVEPGQNVFTELSCLWDQIAWMSAESVRHSLVNKFWILVLLERFRRKTQPVDTENVCCLKLEHGQNSSMIKNSFMSSAMHHQSSVLRKFSREGSCCLGLCGGFASCSDQSRPPPQPSIDAGASLRLTKGKNKYFSQPLA